jgi:peptide/nickel transport system substrate-binding protein
MRERRWYSEPTRRSTRSAVSVLIVVGLTGAALVATAPDALGHQMQEHAARRQKGPTGSVTFALEAETSSGFCLPQTQLAASGLEVAAAIYDTLTTITSDGQYVPYLAKAVTPNASFDEWTIKLRDGVTFHDGTPVDADAIKLNLDTDRGANPALPARLGVFTFANIDTVTVVDPLTVSVSTKTPWPAFPAFFASSATGIVAPAQLNNPDTCARNMIGSGPFRFQDGDWRQNESLTVTANPSYWREGYPKVAKIVFRPTPEPTARVNGLRGGEFDLIQTSDSLSIVDLRQRAKDGDIKLLASDKGAEVSYLMFNSGAPPFDDPIARQAVSYAADLRKVNTIRNKGLNTTAGGPFPPDNAAYLPKVALKRNLTKAKALAKQYEAKHGEPLRFEYLSLPDTEQVAIAQLVKEQQAQAGIEVTLNSVDQPTLIDRALAGQFTAVGWRNHPGGDPDTQYQWWHSGSPVNFGRINDPKIDALLEQGRVETDPAKRVEIYKDLTRAFARGFYNLWVWYQFWAVGYQNDVTGVVGPPLPDGGGRPFPLFGGVIPVLGITKH